jgi:hypothetical protein
MAAVLGGNDFVVLMRRIQHVWAYYTTNEQGDLRDIQNDMIE